MRKILILPKGSQPGIKWQLFLHRFFYVGGDDHKVLRFCFAKKDETLIKAAEEL